jgi:hypothetical protein
MPPTDSATSITRASQRTLRTTRFLSPPNSISCPMPQVSQASTATDQSAPSFGFNSSLVILSFTSHWLGCLTFFNSLLSNYLCTFTPCNIISSSASKPRRLLQTNQPTHINIYPLTEPGSSHPTLRLPSLSPCFLTNLRSSLPSLRWTLTSHPLPAFVLGR